MSSIKKIKPALRGAFQKNLFSWYKLHSRSLPWRTTRDPYKIWISEIMLQQTTVATVIPYYQRWIKAFPDIQTLAKAPLKKVLKEWQGLGYYQRARNLHKAASIMVSRFGSKVPSRDEDLKNLPGFGSYTVAAVLSIAFDKRRPLIDANVRRVVMRVKAIKGFAQPAQDEAVGEFLEEILPQKNNRIFNQALMELGALVCRSREPLCLNCPWKKICSSFKKGFQDIIPLVKQKNIEKVSAVCAIIEKDGRFFIQQRPKGGLLADLWEFPGGKIEKNETPKEALRRELKEEINARVLDAKHVWTLKHAYTRFQVSLKVWKCRVEPMPQEDATHRWVNLKNLTRYPLPSATARIVEKVLKGGSGG